MFVDIPLTAIKPADIRRLVEHRIRENRRLDFKATLNLANREQRLEFLRDIISMANADGGTILYGIEEGEAEDAGVAVALPGISLDNELSNLIDSLTRECIDESLTVLHHTVELTPGRFVFIVRIPASPLAPHMIANLKTAPPRFYVRANTSNEPMTARQIKEAALRHGDAFDRAVEKVSRRVQVLRARAAQRHSSFGHPTDSQNQLLFHVVPLFPHAGGWNYADPTVNSRLMHTAALGWGDDFGDLSFTQHGAFREYPNKAHTGFLRDGSLEGQEFDIARPSVNAASSMPSVCLGTDLLKSVDGGIRQAEKLSEDGLLPVPVLVQLHLLEMHGVVLQDTLHGRASSKEFSEIDVATEAFVLTDWNEKNKVLRNLFDHVWQAWGNASCPLFEKSGEIMVFDRHGHRIAPQAGADTDV